MADKPKYPVRTLEKTLRIVDALMELDTAGVTELAEYTGYGKSLIHGHLTTLEERGYVVQQDTKYTLGLRFLDVGGRARSTHKLYKYGKDEVQALMDDTGELTNMMTEENGQGIDLYRCAGGHSLQIQAHEGRHSDLHCTALGKAILSQLDESRVQDIIDQHGLPEKTSKTVTNREALFQELDHVREHGYAIDDEERTEGLRCIAAPVNGESGNVLGAISVSAPISRMQGEWFENELPERILSAVNVIELNVRYS